MANIYIKKALLFITFIFTLIGFIGCSSYAKKQARALMQTENYFEARSYWIQELQNSPDDKEAIAGKLEAEEKYFEKKLLQIRDFRMAKQYLSSLEAAYDYNKYMTQWKHSPNPLGAHFFAQEKNKIFPLILKELNNWPALKMSYYYKKLVPIFMSEYAQQVNALDNNIQLKGRQQCQSLIKKSRHQKVTFFHNFAAKICHLYKMHYPHQNDVDEDLYSEIQIQGKIFNMNKSKFDNVRSEINKAFISSPWYHRQGRKDLQFLVRGELVEQEHSHREQRIHQYQEDVTYTEYETRPKPKQEKPLRSTQTEYETIPVKKTKKVPRQYLYYVDILNQYFYFQLDGLLQHPQWDTNHQKFTISYRKEEKKQIETSRESRPDIGLYASYAPKAKFGMWEKNSANEIQKLLSNKLSNRWKEFFCKDFPTDLVGGTHQRLKCLRGDDLQSNNAQMIQWFQQNYGLGPNKIKNLIDI